MRKQTHLLFLLLATVGMLIPATRPAFAQANIDCGGNALVPDFRVLTNQGPMMARIRGWARCDSYRQSDGVSAAVSVRLQRQGVLWLLRMRPR